MWTPSQNKGKPFPIKKVPVEAWAIGSFKFKGIPGVSKVRLDRCSCCDISLVISQEGCLQKSGLLLPSTSIAFLMYLQTLRISCYVPLMSWSHNFNPNLRTVCVKLSGLKCHDDDVSQTTVWVSEAPFLQFIP